MTFPRKINSHVNRLQAINFTLLRTDLLTLLGKTNDIQINTGHENTEHALTTIYHPYFFNTSCLSEEMKDKCIAIIQMQIIMKIII